jgi:predicted ATPase
MLNELVMSNFKGFGFQTIGFNNLTLLSGFNGSGKSTVLQALLLLRQSYTNNFLPSRGLMLNGPLVEIGKAQDALFDGADVEYVGLKLKFDKNDLGEWNFLYDRSSDVLGIADMTIEGDIQSQSLFTNEFQYLSAERIGPRTSFMMSDYLVKQNRQLGIRGEYTSHFLSEFGSVDIPITKLCTTKASSQSLLHQTEAYLQLISPGVRLYVAPHTELDLVQISYSFIHGNDESNRYRPTNVGFGLTYTLPVIVALLSSKPGSILLIENPEAHLHGRGQRLLAQLAAAAAESGVHVIIETHSDHILNGIRIAIRNRLISKDNVKVHFFQRATNSSIHRQTVFSPLIDSNGRIHDAPAGFFDEWDRCLDELIAEI